MRFKFLSGTIFLVALTVGAAFVFRHSAQERLQAYLNKQDESFSLKATRPIPENIDISSFLAGLEALGDKDYPSAESYFEKVIALDPDNKEVKMKLFALSGLTGNTGRSIELAHQLRGEENFLVEHTILADLIRQGKYKEALAYIKSEETKTFSSIFTQIALAWIYAGLEEKSKAFDALEGMPENLNWIKIQHGAMLHAYFGEITASKEKISQFATQDIPFASMWYYILRILSFSEIKENELLFKKFKETAQSYVLFPEIGKQAEMMRSFSPRVGIADALNLMYMSIGRLPDDSPDKLEKNRGRLEDGLIFIGLASFLDEFSIYQFVVAEQSELLKLYDRALAICESLLKYPRAQQTVEWLRLKKSDILIKMHRFKAAYRLLYQMMSAGSHNPLMYQRLIDISIAVGKYDDALNFFDKLMPIMLPKAHPTVLSRLYEERATVYFRLNDKDAMIKDLSDAINYNQKNAEALNTLGYEWIESSDDSKTGREQIMRGLELVLEANRYSPNVYYILDSIAWGYYRLEDYSNAVKYAEKAVKLPHETAIIEMHLGDIYAALNNETGAQAQYRKALMNKKDLSESDIKRMRRFLNEEVDESESDVKPESQKESAVQAKKPVSPKKKPRKKR